MINKLIVLQQAEFSYRGNNDKNILNQKNKVS